MGDEEKAKALEDNILLKQELKDLKQAYKSIGNSMYEVVKDNVYHGFEAYLARKKVGFIYLFSLFSSHILNLSTNQQIKLDINILSRYYF